MKKLLMRFLKKEIKKLAFDAWVARDQSDYNFEDWFKNYLKRL